MSGKGMSSEQLDKLTTSEGDIELQEPENDIDKLTTEADEKTEGQDDSLAKEALDATEGQDDSTTPAGQPDTAVAGLQAERDRLITEISGLRNARRQFVQSEQPQMPQSLEAEISPLEKFVKEHPDDVVPSKVLLEETKFQRVLEQHRNQQMQQQNSNMTVTNSIEQASREITNQTHGIGFQTLAQLGSHLLTAGDRLDITKAGANAGNLTYDRLKRALIEAGGPVAKFVQDSLNVKSKTNSSSNQTPTKQKPKTATNQSQNQGGADNDTDLEPNVRASTRAIIQSLGFST